MTSFRLAFLFLGLTMAACSTSSDKSAAPAAAAPKAHGESAEVRLTSTVEAIDVPARQITLKSQKGKSGTFLVGPEVKRFAEIKVGDTIVTDYRVAANAELREATAEEKAAPLMISAGAQRAPADQPPAATLTRGVRAVLALENLDAKTQTFTIRGPLDGTVQVHVDDAAAFAALKNGQTVVVTFSETLKLSVEPAPKNN